MPLNVWGKAGGEVTVQGHGRWGNYVGDRNANFARICTVGCAFCGFGKRPGTVGATADRIDEVVARVGQTPWVTEVCLQGGIDPGPVPYTPLTAPGKRDGGGRRARHCRQASSQRKYWSIQSALALGWWTD